jgi:peptide/nickel transport system permease protein
VLPASGMGDGGSAGFDMTRGALRHLMFPVVTLSMVPVGIIAPSARSAIAEVMAQKFVVTLRANGLPEWRAMRHVLKNALPSVLAVMGLQFGTLMGGSILVETVFSYPGSGFLLSKAILARDIPVLQGTILVLAMVFAVTNLVVDLVQSTPAPRTKRA